MSLLVASSLFAPGLANAQAIGWPIDLPDVDLLFLHLDPDEILSGLNPQTATEILNRCTPVPQENCLSILNSVGDAISLPQQAVTNSLAATTVQTNQQIADFALTSVDTLFPAAQSAAVVSSLSPVATTFGISGVSATSHDGFEIDSPRNARGRTPDFDTLDAGGTLGLRVDASRALGWSSDTLTLGLFGNYTSTDIDFGSTPQLRSLGIRHTGDADLNSGSAGGYALLTNGTIYGLAIGSGEFGDASIRDTVINSRSNFDTSGFSSSMIGGIVMPAWSRTKLDVRGGLNYLSATGDSHVDTAGISFSDGELREFSGTISGRLFQNWEYANSIIRPFVQVGLDHRFSYENEVRVDGIKYSFDEGDDTLFGRVGIDVDVGDRVQAYLAFRGDHNEDFDTAAGQVGITLRLN
jgi:hypothetical protein